MKKSEIGKPTSFTASLLMSTDTNEAAFKSNNPNSEYLLQLSSNTGIFIKHGIESLYKTLLDRIKGKFAYYKYMFKMVIKLLLSDSDAKIKKISVIFKGWSHGLRFNPSIEYISYF